jgi:SAM-dependent methyltransferase
VSCRDDAERFERIGRDTRALLLSALPAGWSFDGRRVLDFGCGPGRALRWLADEAHGCEFYACDIHRESVDWVQANLCPPFRAFVNGAEPPLDLRAGSLDLVYAISVFTHLADSWSRWLAELHRLLRPGGLLLATFMGPGPWGLSVAARLGIPYDERIGMHVEQPWGEFEHGHGPAVFHSEWWLRERWGRAFDFLALEPLGFAPVPEHRGQGFALMRRRDVTIAPADLERPGDDPREIAAALRAAEVARLECAAEVRAARADAASARADAERVRAELAAVRGSSIMRATERPRRLWYRLKGR